MKPLRNKYFGKVIAIFFLLVFIQAIFLPHYAYALTTGPHQPEYTSYESPGATDMVNLHTGDFTFSLPVVDVPGPEGGFSMPLTYNAGIGLEQEASWVGLGWTMNAGAITRSINAFPDDAAGESQNVSVQDLTGVRGWSSNLPFNFGNIGWNTQSGHYGSVSLGGIGGAFTVNYSNGEINSVGLSHNSITLSKSGVGFSAEKYALHIIQVGVEVMSILLTLTGVGKPAAIAMKMAVQGITKAAVSIAMAAAFSGPTPNGPSLGYWEYTNDKDQKWFHKQYHIYLDQSRWEKMYGSLYLGKVDLGNYVNPPSGSGNQHPTPPVVLVEFENGGVTEQLKAFPKTQNINEGAASDITMHVDDNTDYKVANNPAFLAYDDYSVKAPGISGPITPYRFDVGSVAMPREMTENHVRMAPVPHLDYKVPFIYQGSTNNSYYHHVGGTSAPTAPNFFAGVSFDITDDPEDTQDDPVITYKFNDVTLKSQRLKSGLNAATPKIPQGNHIEWLTNEEIKSSTTYPSGFMDILSPDSPPGGGPSPRATFRTFSELGNAAMTGSFLITKSPFTLLSEVSQDDRLELQLNSSVINHFSVDKNVRLEIKFYPDAASQQAGTGATALTFYALVKSINTQNNTIRVTTSLPMPYMQGYIAEIDLQYSNGVQAQNSIGGYMITSADGMNYHFALPVFDYDYKTEVMDITDPTNKKSLVTRAKPFANTWLLTAITGPDFIDRDNNGMVSEGDWGYWVKFNYGKHSDSFGWRLPYDNFKRSPDNKTDSYAQGAKQMYYLNTIETRSHVALFLKDLRSDSRSVNGVSSLNLEEICVVPREVYAKLTTPTANGGYGITDFSKTVSTTCLSSSFAATSTRNYLNSNVIRRVLLTHTYDLCQQTTNSFSAEKGKLTLTRVSLRGKNDVLLAPDYKFEYAYNPSFNRDKWDGWGMYNSSGTSSVYTHNPSDLDQDGYAWSLRKIITPLGAEIEVAYERDTYNSVSGQTVYAPSDYFTSSAKYIGSPTEVARLYMSNTANYAVNDVVRFTGSSNTFTCPGSSSSNTITFDGTYTVTGKTSTYLVLDRSIYTGCSQSGGLYINSQYGYVGKVAYQKKGGGIRTHSIITRNENGVENKIRYLYTNANGTSSGVVAKEPEYSRSTGYYDFYDLPLYPFTPVLYGKVTVLNGRLSDDNDFHTKQVYEFETPHPSMVENVPQVIKTGSVMTSSVSVNLHKVQDHLAKIGNINSIRVEDKQGNLVSETSFDYTPTITNGDGINHQGVFTEGVLMMERIGKGTNFSQNTHKLNRTTVIHHPSTLQRVTMVKDGFTSITENTAWDGITSQVRATKSTAPNGLTTKTFTVPAFRIGLYATMGSRATNLNYKNMLLQQGTTESYFVNPDGQLGGLIAASAQKWEDQWTNYREYNESTFTYSDGNLGGPVWRSAASYVWKGSNDRMFADGSFQYTWTDQFDFADGATNPLWQFLGENTRFDHYSLPLEVKDLNNIYSSLKMGYGDKLEIANATNARYLDIAFSGAEDQVNSKYFGGEVAIGDGTIVSTPVHTGVKALSLSNTTTKGFIFKIQNALPGKTYKASVWANNTNGRIYYSGIHSGTPTPGISQAVTKKDGSVWYRLDVNIKVPTSATAGLLEIGVKSNSGAVIFDDFRVQPDKSVMSCYVYDPLTWQVTYVLDNFNLFTRYEYDDRGFAIRTYQESLKYGEKLISESRDNFRRSHEDQ